MIAGTTGRVQTDLHNEDDDHAITNEAQSQAITEALGVERRNAVLAAVYTARSDVSVAVRQVSPVDLPLQLSRSIDLLANFQCSRHIHNSREKLIYQVATIPDKSSPKLYAKLVSTHV